MTSVEDKWLPMTLILSISGGLLKPNLWSWFCPRMFLDQWSQPRNDRCKPPTNSQSEDMEVTKGFIMEMCHHSHYLAYIAISHTLDYRVGYYITWHDYSNRILAAQLYHIHLSGSVALHVLHLSAPTPPQATLAQLYHIYISVTQFYHIYYILVAELYHTNCISVAQLYHTYSISVDQLYHTYYI